ncbi:hypothetical protein ILYODFUR_000820 [Ilyodon furcidens]|uniref:Uncharacterized protein n=1 Tax=Ilyodon furcidens TaxID=33524 RepID=A0ABV0U2Q5_9TELE
MHCVARQHLWDGYSGGTKTRLELIAEAADSVETHSRPSPQTPPPAPPGGAHGVPRPAERHDPSSVSWAVPWTSSRWDIPGTPPEEGVQEAKTRQEDNNDNKRQQKQCKTVYAIILFKTRSTVLSSRS